MPDAVARRLLTRGLPAMAAGLERDLLDLTGRWPLLLNLVNHRLAGDVDRGAHIDVAAAAAAGRLREGGPAALDITDSGQRQTAVAATVGTAWTRWIPATGTGSSSWGSSPRTPRSRCPPSRCCGREPPG